MKRCHGLPFTPARAPALQGSSAFDGSYRCSSISSVGNVVPVRTRAGRSFGYGNQGHQACLSLDGQCIRCISREMAKSEPLATVSDFPLEVGNRPSPSACCLVDLGRRRSRLVNSPPRSHASFTVTTRYRVNGRDEHAPIL